MKEKLDLASEITNYLIKVEASDRTSVNRKKKKKKMSNVYLNCAAAFVAMSMFLTICSGQNIKQQTNDAPKELRQLGPVIYESSLPDSRGKNVAAMSEVFPLQQTSNNGLSLDNILLYDDDDNGDEILDDGEIGSFINSDIDDQPFVFAKRGRYHNKNQGHSKRNSLSDLIRRLMALKGNSFTDGRITMMRFGTGRRK